MKSVETLKEVLRNVHNVPSIPTKAQSYGYEAAPEDPARLVLQTPSYAIGYTGDGSDRVGPLDYNPKVPSRVRTVQFANKVWRFEVMIVLIGLF